MKKIKLKYHEHPPKNYTGIAEFSNGTKYWFLNGKWHREDGPAVIWTDRTKFFYLNDKLLDEQKINQLINEFEYPVEVAIKLVYLLEINKS